MIAPLLLSAVALWAADKPIDVQVAPTGPGSFGGAAFVDGSQVWIGEEATRDAVRGHGPGLLTLLHEVGHTVGFEDEREATCFGLRKLRPALRKFWHFKSRRVQSEYRDAITFMRSGWGEPYQCSTIWTQVG